MKPTANNPNWIAVDWGTTNLRIWHCDENGGILHETKVSMGMGKLSQGDYESVLLSHIEQHLLDECITDVLVCGMAGARQGWQDAGYLTAPCALPALNQSASVKTSDPRIAVRILPGIKQLEPADVMRGEETQIAGLLGQDRNYCGIICLPGTHSKWVYVQDGQITEFQTFMTGEIFELLSCQSVLKHSLNEAEFSQMSFVKAVTDAVHNPATVSSELFRLRAQHLVNDADAGSLRARLSGLLIGQEIAAMKNNLDRLSVTLIGDAWLCSLYKAALDLFSQSVVIDVSDAPTLRGLVMLRKSKG